MPLKTAVPKARQWNIDGVELDAWGELFPRNLGETARRQVRHLVTSHELEVAALACPLRHGLDVAEGQETRLEYLRECMTLSCDLGSRLIVIYAGQVSEKEDDAGRGRLREALDALARHGDRIGCRVALETGLDAPQTLLNFLDAIDAGSLAVSYNPGNLLIHGHDPYSALRLMQARLAYAHARDARRATAGRLAQEVPLGRGDLDWLRLADIAREIEYRGYLAIERECTPGVAADLVRGVEFLRTLFSM